ncbi:Fibrinogen-like protein 1,Tenascin,Ryncolin-2,Ryncolin-4,Ficolin-1-B,Ficolin-1-A,Angiopoietin-related protein 1,Ficolin-2,Ryncolin-1,Tenascin-R,Ryncolin-3,Ficolin-1,Angiopoietin-4 [Mytilus coruscus]|uniref:Fibrinogen-like protein 1,Tenascin,Ryncolin-2,Ryncolin-4,Ficolin-1-B,Ficolin-1-A,An giopoietin-related protein 1,Ficolin-2,Ryncolin-1,Tenascin-R,Ryncolin-3,Ficolin-1,Angi opoietin-4 n=1 Tax=Mytilus coruscus TaxID=42192 RepID=A0A6J8ATK3_MYTCO|nr:Fibrinogen-like protein 1,Tenascin,Ryncolin-2,Ryncolin-4,Ficolin-1-B,Ficolin-1-A,Angiopoietin-related protein 1,Ficolin-2,Ryncolin-1,Tenascin-R,Ryncolin-3,Ficolin-1,Angiopoietin-4 [Mytilus coruscus]
MFFSTTPADCSELPPGTCSGVYTIQPKNGPTMIVFCEMDTDRGGWTTIQRRYNGSVDFYRDWNEYKTGFGYIAGEHWLGNDNLHYILRQQNSYQVRFDLEDINRISAYAIYDTIYVGNESTNYQITITGYSGTAGDSMMDGQKNPTNGRMFSTRDRDNDIHTSLSCSIDKKSGWWHGRCTKANINGVFLLESYISANIHWVPWRRGDITKTRMSVKPRI